MVGVGPKIQIARNELAAVIDSDRFRIADPPADPLERLHDNFASIAEARISRRAKPRMRVDDSQDAEFFTQGKLVVNEVHRSDIVRPSGLLAVFSKLCLHPALRVLVLELQAQLVVNLAGLLDIDDPSLPSQKHVDAPVAIAHTRFCNLFDPPLDGSLVRPPGLVVVGGGVEADGPG